MQITMATEPGRPDHPNEDFIAATPEVLVLLDGAGTPPGLETNCTHSVAWYVRQLGPALLTQAHQDQSLTETLAAAITTVTATHADTCDLSNSGGPSATVIIARVKGPVVEYLVLADSTLLIREGDRVHAITDGREAAVGRTYRSAMDSQWNGTVAHEAALGNYIRALRAHRNTKDGFWVASSDPAAAEEAITGRCPVANIATIALLSDGATRLVDRFGILTWAQVLSLTELPHGPRRLIEQTREAESSDTAGVRWPRGKVSDDASIVILKY